MALLSAPTFFSPPGFPSFCLSPLSAIFLPLKIRVLIAPASCWQFSLWYLDSPLFDSSSGGKGEKTSRCLWVFRWGFPGCPQGLQEHGWGKKKKKHFLFSHFCLLQLSVFVYLSICRWLSRQIHPYICLFWHAVRGRGGQCLTGFHLWLDCCQDYRIKTQKKSRPNLMMLLECLTIICLCCAVLSRVQLCWHRLLCPWGFSRQENWSGLPCPPPDDLPNPGIEPGSPALQADSLPWEFQFTWVCYGGTGESLKNHFASI